MTSPSLEPRADDGGPAFPVPTTPGILGIPEPSAKAGMTLLDWFAGQALGSVLYDCRKENTEWHGLEEEEDQDNLAWAGLIAEQAYTMAAAMVAKKRSLESDP